MSPTATSPASEASITSRRTAKKKNRELGGHDLFLNRELSWLEFNRKVFWEAIDRRNPLLERVKFLAIFFANLDEFFMIRVSGLRRQLKATAPVQPPADGMSPGEQIAAIQERLAPMLEKAARCWLDELKPELDAARIKVLEMKDLGPAQKELLRRHFQREIFPALTPLAFDPSHPFPHISNLSMNLAVVVREPGESEDAFARIKVPQVFPRLLRIPPEEEAAKFDRLDPSAAASGETHVVWLEDVVELNLDLLFPGVPVLASYPFRITRDADYEIEEDEAADLLETVEEVVGRRHFGFAVRLEVAREMPETLRRMLAKNVNVGEVHTFAVEGPIGLGDLIELTKLDRPELKDKPFSPHVPSAWANAENVFDVLRQRDLLLYHPYDSFQPVVDFLRAAANDPEVVTIKQTLYRVGGASPIVRALMEARENGKQVAVLVELKARFDEENNIEWARALEKAGVHVVYGVFGLKTHVKTCLVVRREAGGLRSYVHVGTGNYNPGTARVYTDIGYFTCDPDIACDVSDLFNRITGISRKTEYRKLLVAPESLRPQILARIEREIEVHRQKGGGHIAFKLNALADKACIEALYRASQEGVKVELQIRGICCLRPGVPGVSDNIEVTSIVGRFLEHSRIFYFGGGGQEEILIGSADLMPRNLDGRVEILCPIEDPKIRLALRDEILFPHLKDTCNARRLKSDGTYQDVLPQEGEAAYDTQTLMLEKAGRWNFG
jgi:polyphosphate kinase